MLNLEVFRQREQTMLKDSEEKYRLLMSSIKDYAVSFFLTTMFCAVFLFSALTVCKIFMINTQGFVTSWNEGCQQMTGWPTEEIIGKHLSMMYPLDEDGDRAVEMVRITAASSFSPSIFINIRDHYNTVADSMSFRCSNWPKKLNKKSKDGGSGKTGPLTGPLRPCHPSNHLLD